MLSKWRGEKGREGGLLELRCLPSQVMATHDRALLSWRWLACSCKMANECLLLLCLQAHLLPFPTKLSWSQPKVFLTSTLQAMVWWHRGGQQHVRTTSTTYNFLSLWLLDLSEAVGKGYRKVKPEGSLLWNWSEAFYFANAKFMLRGTH